MKKIVRQQNYLKDLIEAQGNKYLSKLSLGCLVKSIIEPLLDNPEDGAVLYRIENTTDYRGMLKRLEFSQIPFVNYSDNAGNLVEKVWAKTEFLCVLTHRYVALLVWDLNTGDENLVRYYSLYNSKLQDEVLNIIQRNSKVDISDYLTRFHPDRRDNSLLNVSLRKLISNIDERATDAVMGFAEKNAETFSEADYLKKKTRYISHEIKNQISICDLYLEIMRRHLEKASYENLEFDINSISKALNLTKNLILSLKSESDIELSEIELNTLVQETLSLSRIYLDGLDIDLQVELTENTKVLVNADKLMAVIINLIKNATEAFKCSRKEINGKYIKIKTEVSDDFVCISLSNNAEGIKDTEKIFNEGFTTKSSGSGLGLWICKKNIEDMAGEIFLSRSTEDFTEFTIKLKL